jgi:hypothetical protein
MQREKLGILVTYKNREEHLKVFIPYMKYYMDTNFPEINYQIYIIEQGNDKSFNKGILYNAGFDLTKNFYNYISLHDIDMLPISANYSYSNQPVHLPMNIFEQATNGKLDGFYTNNIFNYFGGVINITNEQYIEANGHSNNYWGWGSVDDDFGIRLNYIKSPLIKKCLTIDNKIIMLGNYVTLHHEAVRYTDEPFNEINTERLQKMNESNIDFKKDGLSNIKYKLIKKEDFKDYIKYIIDF